MSQPRFASSISTKSRRRCARSRARTGRHCLQIDRRSLRLFQGRLEPLSAQERLTLVEGPLQKAPGRASRRAWQGIGLLSGDGETAIASQRHFCGNASRIGRRFAAMRRSVAADECRFGWRRGANAGSARPRSGRCGVDRHSPKDRVAKRLRFLPATPLRVLRVFRNPCQRSGRARPWS